MAWDALLLSSLGLGAVLSITTKPHRALICFYALVLSCAVPLAVVASGWLALLQVCGMTFGIYIAWRANRETDNTSLKRTVLRQGMRLPLARTMGCVALLYIGYVVLSAAPTTVAVRQTLVMFTVGLCGLLMQRHILVMVLCVAAALNGVAVGLAAVEPWAAAAVIGLSVGLLVLGCYVTVAVYQARDTVDIEELDWVRDET